MLRSFSVALAFLLLSANGASPALQDHPLSIYTKDGYRLEQPLAKVRRQAGHIKHRRSYQPRETHARRLSRWEHHKPVRPVGAPPEGYSRSKSAATDLLAQARYTIGAGPRQLGVPSTLWCADAVNVWLRRSGLPVVKSRWARAFADYGTRAAGPAPGTIAVFPRGRAPRGHVGVVAAVRGNTVEVISGNCGPRVCVSSYPANRAIAYRWPGSGPGAAPARDIAKVIPLPRVKVARIPVPRPRPVLAADFAELDMVPADTTMNLALLDIEAMPVALTSPAAVVIELQDPLLEARKYLVATATPGLTMQWQGAGLAIERLHPQFAIRLAEAIRVARQAGLERAGIYSAYRPPAFGVGGFSDKFNSLHAYGMAVDMTGIGGPGSAQSLQWNRIAARFKIYGPYGPTHRAEWNHYQPTWTRAIARHAPLRKAITASGPIDLPRMWKIADSLIDTGPQRIIRIGKKQRKYAKRWSKKRWAAFNKLKKKKLAIKKLKKKKWRYASR